MGMIDCVGACGLSVLLEHTTKRTHHENYFSAAMGVGRKNEIYFIICIYIYIYIRVSDVYRRADKHLRK